jgi:diguanylate cyclase
MAKDVPQEDAGEGGERELKALPGAKVNPDGSYDLKDDYLDLDDDISPELARAIRKREIDITKALGGATDVALHDKNISDARVRFVEGTLKQVEGSLKKVEVERDDYKGKSMIDPLTGLSSRRNLFEALERETSKASRLLDGAEESEDELFCMMIDADHFKNVNDKYGHSTGDQVLKGIADVLKGAVRDSDVVGRYGGEEFAIVAWCKGRPAARELAERIRKKIESTDFYYRGEKIPNVTVSVGVEQYDKKFEIDEFVEQADHNLYIAKRGGGESCCDGLKNRINQKIKIYG